MSTIEEKVKLVATENLEKYISENLEPALNKFREKLIKGKGGAKRKKAFDDAGIIGRVKDITIRILKPVWEEEYIEQATKNVLKK